VKAVFVDAVISTNMLMTVDKEKKLGVFVAKWLIILCKQLEV